MRPPGVVCSAQCDATTTRKQAASKGKKGGKAVAAEAGVSLDGADRAEYNKLKATGELPPALALRFACDVSSGSTHAERQRTADLREALGKLQRLQSADEAEAAKAKNALDVLQQKEGGCG